MRFFWITVVAGLFVIPGCEEKLPVRVETENVAKVFLQMT